MTLDGQLIGQNMFMKAVIAVDDGALAKEKNVNFLFEASVGGGIPIIRPLNSCASFNTSANSEPSTLILVSI